MFHVKHDGAIPAPDSAREVFGSGLDRALRYAEILADAGVERGLLGPREAPRLWDRHLLNSAAVGELIPSGSVVGDIGSGAGLPGIPLAIARPDIRVTLIEPLLRRATFLTEVIDDLGLNTVAVVRGRAEDPAVRREHGELDVVVSRAVASLDKVARWSAPLLRSGGVMLAMKGDRAEAEMSEYGATLQSLGMTDVEVMRCGVDYLMPPATVVVGHRTASGRSGRGSRQPGDKKGR
ncbi:16S rRNA (guanine(527)-N(7))-methyltransferase RsmG [Mycolicibacterium palauense]|uniref:16S rRNA (guanine(527)-N(7))-methyltransferase RsmG n=1 Tax=Mycolicibacterium palauense TaxID=2034511 RepID=UPI000BFEEB0A|nr:16S rRNA (guanine(527)-N(7))-methyltransferase RsmG [Mycolicibacterium palauense]